MKGGKGRKKAHRLQRDATAPTLTARIGKTDIPYYLLIAGCSLIAYWNSLENGFAYDDHSLIVNNPAVRSFSVLLSTVRFYRPVRWFSFALDYHFWQLNPAGYHLSNILLHAACALLVFRVSNLIIKDKLGSLMASLLFCTYPLMGEAVNNVANRNELLGTFFSLSAFYFYMRKGRSLLYILAVPPLHFLGLMSKEAIAVSLPLLYIAYDLYFTRNDDGTFSLSRSAPGFAFILASIIAIGYGVTTMGESYSVRDVFLFLRANTFIDASPVLINMVIWVRAMAKGILLVLYPVNLSADYPVPHITSILEKEFILSSLVIVMYLLAIVFVARRSKPASFGLLWFLIFFLPVSNIIPITNHYMADRYLYAPSIGYYLFAGVIFAALYRHRIRILRKRTQRVAVLALLLVCLALSLRADWRRNRDWKSDFTIWLKTAQQQPKSPKAQYNAGARLLLADKTSLAVEYLNNARSIYKKYNIHAGEPENMKDRISHLTLKSYVATLSSLGTAYYKMGRYEEAVRELESAIELQSNDYYLYFNIGLVHMKQGRLDEAVRNLEKAVALDDRCIEAHRALADAYRLQGRDEEAQREYDRARQLMNKASGK